MIMRVFTKRNNRLVEGVPYRKSELRLSEDVDANLGSANGIQAAQMKAKQLMSKNPNVNAASADAGKLDGSSDSSSGEGMKLQVPVDAKGSQLSSAQSMIRNQSNDDMEIEFTKDTNSTDSQDQANESLKERLANLRENSIPFTKKSLTSFLKSI